MGRGTLSVICTRSTASFSPSFAIPENDSALQSLQTRIGIKYRYGNDHRTALILDRPVSQRATAILLDTVATYMAK